MNTRTEATGMLCVLLTLIGSCSVLAQSYKVDWNSVNSGGGVMSGGGYKITGTIGQPAAGFTKSTSFLHWIGFWSGEVPTPTAPPSIGAAKMLPDETYVSISGRIATTSATDFAGFFYIEEENQSNGIRVAVSAPVPDLLRGSVVNVIGTLGTTLEGERCLTGPIVIVVSSHVPLTPLGMPNRSVGGGDWGVPPLGQCGVLGGNGLNNIGLLIKSWGRVIETGSDYIVIDDGSSTPVRVSTAGMSSLPGINDYITVVGISSIHKPETDRLRLVLPRKRDDIN